MKVSYSNKIVQLKVPARINGAVNDTLTTFYFKSDKKIYLSMKDNLLTVTTKGKLKEVTLDEIDS